jgi:hypothetical protein
MNGSWTASINPFSSPWKPKVKATSHSWTWIFTEDRMALWDTKCTASSLWWRQSTGRVGVPEGRLQREWLQRPADPQSPQPPSALTPTGQQAPLSRLPALFPNCIQSYKQSAGPTQHQICGLSPYETIQSPPSGQGPPRNKDTWGLKDPLWMRQSLHWADGPFRGHQVKGASRAHRTRTPGQVGRSWAQYRLGTSHSIPQCFHPRQENQIYGPHCQRVHWDWTPPLQYQQRGWLLSQ